MRPAERAPCSPTLLKAPATPTDEDDRATDVLSADGRWPGRARQGPGWPQVRGYEMLSVIGAGGMGIVYKARHGALNRTVALKTLRGAGVDLHFSERLRAEAEAVARLQHPNIVQVFEIGTAEWRPGEAWAGPFIALEFVDGGSLARRTDKAQPPRPAAALVEKLARAVHCVHRLGIVHRDLKPANVLLTADGEPKIADFGLAKQVGTEHDAAGRSLTLDGTLMGTPEYMAPEQATGAAPTPAVDIYALGVILYELLTARVPFQAASSVETMDLARSQEPVSPRRLRPGLPRDLETVCLKCLEKEPARRYATAEALADDLRRFLDDRPVLARRAGSFEKVGRWCRRNPSAAASLAAVAGTFLAAFVLVNLSYWRSERARAEEARQRGEAQRREKSERWERYRANLVAAASALEVYNVGSAGGALEAAPEEHRNWEWRHFHSRLDLAEHVLPVFDGAAGDGNLSADGRRVLLVAGKTARVWDTVGRREVLAFEGPEGFAHAQLSPDGRTVAYRTSQTEVVLRDVDTGRIRAALPGDDRIVDFVSFTLDGTHLATGSDEQPFRFWDVQTGRLVGSSALGGGRHTSVCFSADGRRIASSAPGAAPVRVWDVESGSVLATLPDSGYSFHSAGFNERANRILTVESYPSDTMRLWETATGRLVCAMRGHGNTVTHFAFSPDGTRIASSSRDQTVGLWDAATGRSIAVLRGHRGWVNWVSFSPDGKRLVSASDDHTVRLWDATTGGELAVLPGHTGNVFEVGYTADGGSIVSLSQDGTVRVWDGRAVENDGTLRGHTGFVYGVAFHPDGKRVASASWDGTARIWDATTGRETARLAHGDKAIVTAVAFDPSGKLLATRARDAVRLWDVASGREVHRWDAPGDFWRDTRLAFSPRGDLLAAGCAGCAIRIWDVASRAEVAVLRGLPDQVRDLAFSPDGRWLAWVSERADPVVRVWDVARKEQVHALAGHTAGGYAVAWSADGTLLASGASDGTVRLWETATWTEVGVLKHGTNVYGVAFTPDGTRLACACADNSIRFWDVGTRQQVAELRGHGAYVHQVAFSPDGTRLVSASGDGTVRVWDTVRHQDRVAGGR